VKSTSGSSLSNMYQPPLTPTTVAATTRQPPLTPTNVAATPATCRNHQQAKSDRTAEIKRLNGAIAAVRSELSKKEEALADCARWAALVMRVLFDVCCLW